MSGHKSPGFRWGNAPALEVLAADLGCLGALEAQCMNLGKGEGNQGKMDKNGGKWWKSLGKSLENGGNPWGNLRKWWKSLGNP